MAATSAARSRNPTCEVSREWTSQGFVRGQGIGFGDQPVLHGHRKRAVFGETGVGASRPTSAGISLPTPVVVVPPSWRRPAPPARTRPRGPAGRRRSRGGRATPVRVGPAPTWVSWCRNRGPARRWERRRSDVQDGRGCRRQVTYRSTRSDWSAAATPGIGHGEGDAADGSGERAQRWARWRRPVEPCVGPSGENAAESINRWLCGVDGSGRMKPVWRRHTAGASSTAAGHPLTGGSRPSQAVRRRTNM